MKPEDFTPGLKVMYNESERTVLARDPEEPYRFVWLTYGKTTAVRCNMALLTPLPPKLAHVFFTSPYSETSPVAGRSWMYRVLTDSGRVPYASNVLKEGYTHALFYWSNGEVDLLTVDEAMEHADLWARYMDLERYVNREEGQ
jgi:hypothetical protein